MLRKNENHTWNPMKHSKQFLTGLLKAFLITLFITACEPMKDSAKPSSGKTNAANALVIQADFAGHVMSGVAYTVSKDLEIFNLRPLIDLYDIAAASASLEYNAQTWPSGTVFVSVVDPGVGTKRKSVVLKTQNGLYFVSPDNGSLSGPAQTYGVSAVREIDESINRRPETDWSHTFHGRDVYSYTGARLAAGVITFEQVGSLLEPKVKMLEISRATFEEGALIGLVTGGTGRLGNISFNIDRLLFQKIEPEFGELFQGVIKHKDDVIWQGTLPYAKSFGSVPLGENLMFMNSSGEVSIAVNQDSFARKYSIGSGSNWHIPLRR
jgi:S-adenosylmethionine hydrolase